MIIFIQSPLSGNVETLLNMIFLTLFLIVFSFPLPMPYAPVTPEIIVPLIYTEMFYLGALIFFFHCQEYPALLPPLATSKYKQSHRCHFLHGAFHIPPLILPQLKGIAAVLRTPLSD